MLRIVHRELPPDYVGPVFVWDIDKTYLDTRFSQLKGLLRIPFEFAVDKREIPGTRELLVGLRSGPSGREHLPLFFVSASPYQIRRSVEKKMLLDGVEFDGITFKDPLKALRRGQFDQLKHQAAFKLSALMLLVQELPAGAKLYLFGDDAEADALIYCLLADITAGRLAGAGLAKALLGLGVRTEYAGHLTSLADELPVREALAGIYVHLVRYPSGESIREFSTRVVGYDTVCAAAAHLAGLGLLSAQALSAVQAVASPGEPVFGEVSPTALWTPEEYLEA